MVKEIAVKIQFIDDCEDENGKKKYRLNILYQDGSIKRTDFISLDSIEYFYMKHRPLIEDLRYKRESFEDLTTLINMFKTTTLNTRVEDLNDMPNKKNLNNVSETSSLLDSNEMSC